MLDNPPQVRPRPPGKARLASECPTPEQIGRMLILDRSDYSLTWQPRTPDLFPPTAKYGLERKCQTWNSTYAGKPAFISTHRGYFVGTIWNSNYRAHRIIWVLEYGEWPDGQIDHIDGNGFNNRIENLRVVGQTENARNCGLFSTNTTGTAGIYYDEAQADNKPWVASIRVDGKSKHLGRYLTREEAAAARYAGELIFGFHPNHGRRPSVDRDAGPIQIARAALNPENDSGK